MRSVKLKYSKTQIDKAGMVLKKKTGSEKEISNALGVLSNWRAYHAMPLDTFVKVLKKRVQTVTPNSIVVQRLKRTPSILLKLSNHRTMRLSAMQDIGGLRAILSNTEEVYDLLDLYKKSKSKHSLSSLDDYIQKPKADGYRGIHLVYKLKRDPSMFLEIQLRSQLQHIWATGVEVFGTLKGSSFKTGHGSRQWLQFFAYLSSVFALKEKKPVLRSHKDLSQSSLIKKTQDIIQELQVIENLSVYTSVYKIISTSNSRGLGRRGSYSLILLNSRKNTISFSTFATNQFEEAAQAYLDLERKYFGDTQVNVVLVNTGDIRKLEESYPNYFMDTKTLVRNLSLITMGKFLKD